MQKLLILFACITLSSGNNAVFTRADLVASGLTCSMCSNSIYKALVRLPFVEKVSPDVEHSSFAITFRAGAVPDPDALQQAVTGAGFSVDRLTLTGSLDHVPVRNDAHVTLDGLTFHFLHVPDETLNGETTLRLVDKDFLDAKGYKQYGTYTSMPCFRSGKMGATRVYHVSL